MGALLEAAKQEATAKRSGGKVKRSGRGEEDRHARATMHRAEVSKAEAADRAADNREEARAQLREPYAATGGEMGAAVMRAARDAVRAAGKRIKSSEAERDALAAAAAEVMLRTMRSGAGTGVDAQRFPLSARLAAARQWDGSRGAQLHAHAAQVVAGLMRDSADWLDSLERYRSRYAAKRGDDGLRLESIDAATDAAERGEGGWLAVAAAEGADAFTGPRPLDFAADSIAASLAALFPASEAEKVRAAILQLDGGEGSAPRLAAAEGCTVKAWQRRTEKGRAALRERFPDARDLVDAVRAAAAASGEREGWTAAGRGDRIAVPVDGRKRPVCGLSGAVGASMFSALRPINPTIVEDVRGDDGLEPQHFLRLRAVGAVNGPHAGERSAITEARAHRVGAYSPATVRAAKRNVRADVRTGRYGRGELPASGTLHGTAPRPLSSVVGSPLRISQLDADSEPARCYVPALAALVHARRLQESRERIAAAQPLYAVGYGHLGETA